MRIALSILALVILAGCSSMRMSTVPDQLLTCDAQPASPKGGTQKDASLFVVDLAAAGQDCRSKLGSVRKILRPETK